jgi:hypothetical protein
MFLVIGVESIEVIYESVAPYTAFGVKVYEHVFSLSDYLVEIHFCQGLGLI